MAARRHIRAPQYGVAQRVAWRLEDTLRKLRVRRMTTYREQVGAVLEVAFEPTVSRRMQLGSLAAIIAARPEWTVLCRWVRRSGLAAPRERTDNELQRRQYVRRRLTGTVDPCQATAWLVSALHVGRLVLWAPSSSEPGCIVHPGAPRVDGMLSDAALGLVEREVRAIDRRQRGLVLSTLERAARDWKTSPMQVARAFEVGPDEYLYLSQGRSAVNARLALLCSLYRTGRLEVRSGRNGPMLDAPD